MVRGSEAVTNRSIRSGQRSPSKFIMPQHLWHLNSPFVSYRSFVCVCVCVWSSVKPRERIIKKQKEKIEKEKKNKKKKQIFFQSGVTLWGIVIPRGLRMFWIIINWMGDEVRIRKVKKKTNERTIGFARRWGAVRLGGEEKGKQQPAYRGVFSSYKAQRRRRRRRRQPTAAFVLC